MNELKQLIENIFNLDQQLRKQPIWSVDAILSFNNVTTAILKEGIEKLGMPTSENVGQETADRFVVLLSHCTDVKFMEKIINSSELKNASYNKENIAIAYDNLLVKSGKKQCYGSALEIVEKEDGSVESVPLPIEDAENVDKRRKEFGITTTLDEYIKNAAEILKKIKR